MIHRAWSISLAIALHLAAQPQWKDRGDYEVVWERDPAARLKQLDRWSQEHPEPQFSVGRRMAYLSVYQQLNQQPQVFRVAGEILAQEPMNLQALTAMCWSILRYGAPPADHVEAASQAADRILQNLDTFFSEKQKPPVLTTAMWNQAKEEVRGYALRARDLTLAYRNPGNKGDANVVAPDVLVWRMIKGALVGADGQQYFESGLKGALIPGGIEKSGVPVERFYAKVLSIDANGLLIGRVEGEAPEVRLEIVGEPAKPPRAGMLCGFRGAAQDFRKNPFQLSVRVEAADLDCH